MATYQELRTRSQQVRDEQNIGGNTALRVGQLLMDIVKYFYDNDEAASEYLQQHFAMVNDGTQLLNWQQSPIVILHTMGEAFDDGDWSALSQGENFFRNGFIMEADGQGGGINGETPKANVLYVNLANDTLYTWNGASFDAITSGGGGSISGDDILKNAYYLNGNLVLVFETESGDKTVSIPVNFDASNYVPTSRTVNGKALSSNITLSQSDIPGLVAVLAAKVGYSDDEWLQVKAGAMQAATAVQNTTTVNGKRLNNNIVIGMADIPGLLQAIANAGSGAVSVQQNADGSFSITVGNDTYVFDDFPTKQEMADAIDDALGEAQVTVVPAGSVGVISSLGSDSDEDALSASMGKKLKVAVITILNSLGNYAFPGGKPTLNWGSTVINHSINVNGVTGGLTISNVEVDGVSAASLPAQIVYGKSLSFKLNLPSNLYIYDAVAIIVGGVDITNNQGVWDESTGEVNIAAVTDDVIVTATSLTYVGYGEQNSPLVSMFDGKNVDSTNNQWVDKVDNTRILQLSGCTVASDHVVFDGVDDSALAATTATGIDVPRQQGTIEAVANGLVCNSTDTFFLVMVNHYTDTPLIGMSSLYGSGFNNGVGVSYFTAPESESSSTIPRAWLLGKSSVAPADNIHLSMSDSRAYLNGVALSRSTTTTYTTARANGKLGICCSINASGNVIYKKGNIYCVRVYNRILSEVEVMQNYKVDRKRFNLV